MFPKLALKSVIGATAEVNIVPLNVFAADIVCVVLVVTNDPVPPAIAEFIAFNVYDQLLNFVFVPLGFVMFSELSDLITPID